MLIPLLFTTTYFFACFGVTFAAGNKVVKAQNIFHIAVIFTPLTALIVVALSPKKKVVQSKMIICKNCVIDMEGKHVLSTEGEKKGIVVIEEPNYS